jgi:hypothetical protein
VGARRYLLLSADQGETISAHARRFTDRPEKPSNLPERTPGRILSTHVFYIEKYRGHMDYPEYRRRGWPIGSGHAESLAGQVGMRMKAANKRWTNKGAEATANLIAERTSQDGRRAPPATAFPGLAPPVRLLDGRRSRVGSHHRGVVRFGNGAGADRQIQCPPGQMRNRRLDVDRTVRFEGGYAGS